jgi:hypothetical protein
MKDDIHRVKQGYINEGSYVRALGYTEYNILTVCARTNVVIVYDKGKLERTTLSRNDPEDAKAIITKCASIVMGRCARAAFCEVSSALPLAEYIDRICESFNSQELCRQLCELVVQHSDRSAAGVLAERCLPVFLQ